MITRDNVIQRMSLITRDNVIGRAFLIRVVFHQGFYCGKKKKKKKKPPLKWRTVCLTYLDCDITSIFV